MEQNLKKKILGKFYCPKMTVRHNLNLENGIEARAQNIDKVGLHWSIKLPPSLTATILKTN